MEMLFLGVFVLVWLLVRSRDQKRQARRDQEQMELLRSLLSRVWALESALPRAAVAASTIPVAEKPGAEKVDIAAAAPPVVAVAAEIAVPASERVVAPWTDGAVEDVGSPAVRDAFF